MDIKKDFAELQQKHQEICGHFDDLSDLIDQRNNKKYVEEINFIIKGMKFDSLPLTIQKLNQILK